MPDTKILDVPVELRLELVAVVSSYLADAEREFFNDVVGRDIAFFELSYYMFPIGWLMVFLLWVFFLIFFILFCHFILPGKCFSNIINFRIKIFYVKLIILRYKFD